MTSQSNAPQSTLHQALQPSPKVAQSISRHDLFNGVGEVKVWSLLSPQKLDPFRAALWCELEPHGRVGAHVQQHYPEIILCVAGEGEIRAGSRQYEFTSGVCVPLAKGEIMEIKNLKDIPLTYLIIKAEQPSNAF